MDKFKTVRVQDLKMLLASRNDIARRGVFISGQVCRTEFELDELGRLDREISLHVNDMNMAGYFE